MELTTKVILGLVVSTIASLVITWLFDAWDFYYSVGIFFYVCFYFGAYMYLVISKIYDDKRAESDYEKYESFKACFDLMNQKLQAMYGGDGLAWSEGFSRNSSVRTYKVGEKSYRFRSMLGTTQLHKQPVVVIWNIDLRDIWQYIADPDPQVIKDPFSAFNPEQRDTGVVHNPYRRDGRYPYGNRSGISVTMQGQGYMPQVPDSKIEGSVDKLR